MLAPIVLLAITPHCRLPAQQSAVPAGIAIDARTLHDAQGHELPAERWRIPVPENRTKPGSRTIYVSLIRVRSRAESPGPPIVYLNGGPGQPASPIADSPAALGAWLPLLELGDLILLDQRGTGISEPNLGLPFDESLPENFFADRAVALAYARDSQRRCREHFAAQSVDFSGYNTVESADDVESVRQALGVPQVRLVGFSYGTLLGLTVLRRHGPGIARAVLVGTEAPNDWGSLPTTLQTQIEKLSRLAADDPGVRNAVPDMAALLGKVLAKLEKEPLSVEVQDRRLGQQRTVRLGRWGLEFLLRIDLGDGNDFPYFPALLWSIDQGRTDVVRPFLEKRWNQLSSGASAMSTTMTLSSGPPPWLEQRFAAEAGRCTLRHVVNYFDLEIRDVWNVPLLGDEYRAPIVTTVPTLFVSGTLDCNAPPYQAETIRWGFANSTHLVVENAGHEDMLPNPDVREVIRRFLSGDDARDARVALPRPSFVGIQVK